MNIEPVRPEPMPRAAVKHIEQAGHPSQHYQRTRRAECGRYAYVAEFAAHVDDVTCPGCLAVLNGRETMEI